MSGSRTPEGDYTITNNYTTNQYAEIGRQMGLTPEEVSHHLEIVKRLDPKPGMKYSPDRSTYIIPDVFVVKEGDDFKIILNDDGLPKLRISPTYKRMLDDKETNSQETRDYVKDKLRSALARAPQRDLADHLDAAAARHLHVEQDDVGLGGEHQPHGVLHRRGVAAHLGPQDVAQHRQRPRQVVADDVALAADLADAVRRAAHRTGFDLGTGGRLDPTHGALGPASTRLVATRDVGDLAVIISSDPVISVWRSHVRPKISKFVKTTAWISAPSSSRPMPGIRNRCVGLWTSRKRRWRQPSRKLDSFDSPPRGWYSIGNCSIRTFSLAARMTISEANSIPVVRRSSWGRISRRKPRMPQWASLTPVLKKTLRMPVRIGLPT